MEAAIAGARLPHPELMDQVDTSLTELVAFPVVLPATAFVLVWAIFFVPWRTLRSFEIWWYDWLIMIALVFVYWTMFVSWTRFLWCWSAFKGFLQSLERHPARKAFSRLRKEISWIPLATRPHEHRRFISSRALDCLRAILSFDSSTLKDPGSLESLRASFQEEVRKLCQLQKEREEQLGSSLDNAQYTVLQQQLQSVAVKIVADLENSDWQKGSSDSLEPEDEKRARPRPLAPEEKLRILKEEFVALRYLIFIRYVFRSLRNLLGFVIVAFILSVIATTSYAFQAHRWIGVANGIMFLALGMGVAVVFAGMDKDAILSRISATKANEVGKTFYLRLAQFGALPLLTLVASQFPSVSRFLFSWVQPALESFK